jgi:magnesium transporter
MLSPMNLVTGLWGMNVIVPGQVATENSHSLNWFFGIVGCLLAFAIFGSIISAFGFPSPAR